MMILRSIIAGHMALTESCSHIIAVILSERLGRSWRWWAEVCSHGPARRDDPWVQAAVSCGSERFTCKQQPD